MSKNNRILKPTTNKSTSQSTPASQSKKSDSFFSRLSTAISNSYSSPKSSPTLKVRLINGWQDVNLDRINVIVKNFLYEKNSEMEPKWAETERATGFKREQIFYLATGLLAFVLFFGHFTSTLLLFASIVIPAVFSLEALNAKLAHESQIFWLRYWVVFSIFTVAECCILRVFPNANLDFPKLLLAIVVVFVPYPLIAKIFSFINKRFKAIRNKFDQYNYHVVA